MPRYQVQAPDGRTVTLEGDSPPTEADLDEVFKSLPAAQNAPQAGFGRLREVEGGVARENAPNPALPEPGGIPLQPGEARYATGEDRAPMAGLREFQRAVPGITASVLAPEALLAAVPELSPVAATGLAGYLGRLGLIGGVSGGSGAIVDVAPKVRSGEMTPEEAAKQIYWQTGLGAGGSMVLGPVGQKIIQGGGEALGEMVEGKGGNLLTRGFEGGKAGLLRPLFETEAARQTRAAADLIESVTGIRPAQSVGEALGKTSLRGKPFAEIERELGSEASGALSDEARNRITRSILSTATGLTGTGATDAQLAEMTINALQREIGQNISGPARQAVQDLSTTVARALNDSLENTGQQAFRLTTPTMRATATEAGQIGKQAEQLASDAFQAQEDKLYADYRTLLGPNPPKAQLTNTAKVADDILGGGLKTTDATTGVVGPIGSTVQDAGTRKFLGELGRAAGTDQDIEALRRYRSMIGESIGQDSVLSGLGDANKKRLYAAVSDDIDAAIASIGDPKVKAALEKANAFRRENIDKFKLPSSVKAGRDVEEGGTTGSQLLNSVLGDTDKYNTFISVLGPQAGPFKNAARDYILTQTQGAAATTGGEFSVQKALESLEKFGKKAPEVVEDLLPGSSSRLRELAAKEIRALGLQKDLPSKPDDVLDWVTANKAELDSYLGPGGERRFQDALRAKATEKARFNNAVLSDVAQGKTDEIAKNPVGFLNSIMDGTYSRIGDVREALNVVARHSPDTFERLQRNYLARLMEQSTVDGVISGEELAKRLATPVSGAALERGGKALDTATEILGNSKVDQLRHAAELVGRTQKDLLGKALDTRASLLEVAVSENTSPALGVALAQKAGLGNKSVGFWARVFNVPGEFVYNRAASLVNNPRLLPLLSKPVESLTGAEASEVVNALLEARMNQGR